MAKVLIVEDDELMGRMYEKIFTHENYEVEISVNGEVGLARAREWNPDIVLLDIMMPKMNGFQVLESMKLDSKLSNIPIVMLTNLAGDQDIEEAKKKGAADYIVKSNYTPRQILDMVKKILEGSSNIRSPEATPSEV